MLITACIVLATAWFFFAFFVAVSDFLVSEFHYLGIASWTGYAAVPPAPPEPQRTMSAAAGR